VITTKGFDVGDAILRAMIRDQVGSTVKQLPPRRGESPISGGVREQVEAGGASVIQWKIVA
jgi:hypothetical protein